MSNPVTQEKYRRLLLPFAVAVIAGLQLAPLLTWAPDDLASHGVIADDAYFYSVLAQNFHTYGFLTLDGEMPTNGIQPLWMLVQLLSSKVFPSVDPVTLLARSSWLTFVLFAFAATWFIGRNFSSSAWPPGAIIAATMMPLLVTFQELVVRGLETPLMLLMLVLTFLTLDIVANQKRASPGGHFSNWGIVTLAILSSFTFLARTDLFWVPLVVFAWLMITEKSISRHVLIFGSLLVVIVCPYLLFNYATQDSIVPISARVKLFYLDSFYPDLKSYIYSDEWRGLVSSVTDLYRLDRVPVHIALKTGAVLFLFSLGFFVVVRFRRSRYFPVSLKLLTITVALHIVYMHVVYRELRPYTSYYFAPEIFWLVYVVACYANFRFREIAAPYRARGYLALVIVPVLIATVFWLKYDWMKPAPYWSERLNLARDVRHTVPEGERVGAFWPGLFAQYSGREVVPLDGVVGSNDYFQTYVKNGREIDYLRERKIRFVVVYLRQRPEVLFSMESEPAIEWPFLGIRRLWQNRRSVERVVSARPVSPQGAGWYLIEIAVEDRRRE